MKHSSRSPPRTQCPATAPPARFFGEAELAPVLPDRAAVLNAVARLAVHASMPEPALPLEFKNLKGDAAAA